MTPDPPVDVRLHLVDGTVVPAECVYTGDDPAGNHIWLITVTLPTLAQLDKVTVGELPAYTTVKLPVREL